MKKVKIFERAYGSIEDLESNINDFIKNKNIEDIKYKSYLVPGVGTEHAAMVIYNVNKKELV